MKITKSQLKQIIKETLMEDGFGGAAGNLAAVAGRAGSEEEVDAPDFTLQTDETPDTIVQAHAIKFFMELGLKRKTCDTIVANIAVSDLKVIMNQVPKIDTAAEGT
jgi:hypothetical protein|tara:strand:+ start:429 stop:746 length:318 start_codon:yes stop_codon:yes gene_type:complete